MKKPTSARRALVAIVTLLVLAFGCQDATGPKLGYVPGGGSGGSTTPVSAPYAVPLVVSAGHRYMTWGGGGTRALLSLAAAGHADGGELTIRFAANSATGVTLPASLNTSGDLSVDPATLQIVDWDETVPHVLVLTQIGAYTKGALFALAPRLSSAPTVVSAAASAGNPNAVVVTYSRPVVATDRTGLTVTCSVGGAVTLTAVEAGDGTSAVTYTASRNFASGNVCSFVVGSGRLLTDLDSNLVATSTTSIAMSFGTGPLAIANCVLALEATPAGAASDGITLSGANVTDWADKSTAGLHAVATSNWAQYVADAGDGVPAITTTASSTQRLKVANRVIDPAADWSLFMVYRVAGTGVILSTSKFGVPSGINLDFNENSGFGVFDLFNDASAADEVSPGGVSVNAWHVAMVTRSGSTLSMQVDGGSVATHAIQAGVYSADIMTIGGQDSFGGGAFTVDTKQRVIAAYNRALDTSAEYATLRTWAKSIWTLP